AERRVARQGVSVRLNRERGRDAVRDIDHGAPFGEPCAELVVLDEALAETVQPLGNRLAFEAGQRLCTRVDFDAWNDAPFGEVLRKRRAVFGLLTDRLVIEDDAADVILSARSGEQHFTIGAPMLLGGLELDAVETFLDGARALVRRQHALVL